MCNQRRAEDVAQEFLIFKGAGEILARDAGVFAREALGACAFASCDGLNHGAVVFLRDARDVARLGGFGGSEDEGAGSGEGQLQRLFDGAEKHLALGETAEFGVERFVEREIAGEFSGIDRDERFELREDFAEGGEIGIGVEAFGGEPGGGAFEDAANFNGVPNIGEGEFADYEASGGPGTQETFVGQLLERDAQRGAGDVHAGGGKTGGERKFGKAFAGRKFAAQEEFSNGDDGTLGLAGRVGFGREAGGTGHRNGGRERICILSAIGVKKQTSACRNAICLDAGAEF